MRGTQLSEASLNAKALRDFDARYAAEMASAPRHAPYFHLETESCLTCCASEDHGGLLSAEERNAIAATMRALGDAPWPWTSEDDDEEDVEATGGE